MDWSIIWYLFLSNTIVVRGINLNNANLRHLLDLVQRRSIYSDNDIIGVPQYPEDLPRAERILPGHTLLKPTMGMLKSAVKFPHKEDSQSVYGNMDNIGISYGKEQAQIKYTSFRKHNDLEETINAAIRSLQENNKDKQPVVVIEIDPARLLNYKQRDTKTKITEIENNASEIMDDSDLYMDDNGNLRRSRVKSAFRIRRSSESTESSEDTSTSASSDYERNAGNPYTLHKDKYRQNWLWNHKMDGDHMNVNPYAPIISNYGPSGSSLFFGRKWWYFNQDDFKPLE